MTNRAQARPFETGSFGAFLRESGFFNRVPEERACPELVEGRSECLEGRGEHLFLRLAPRQRLYRNFPALATRKTARGAVWRRMAGIQGRFFRGRSFQRKGIT